MKKLFLFILILGIVFSCEKDSKIINKEYNSFHQVRSTKTYDLDNFNTIDSLLIKFEKDNCNDINTRLSFNNNEKKKIVFITFLCRSNMITSCYKEKNVIKIKKGEFIKNNQKFPLDSFSIHFKKDYLNFGEISNLSTNPNRFLIIIDTKELNLKLLKKQLITITRAYDLLNIDYSLNIELKKSFIEVRPPLPPK